MYTHKPCGGLELKSAVCLVPVKTRGRELGEMSMPQRIRKAMVLCGAVLSLSLVSERAAIARPCGPDKGEAPGIYVPDRDCIELGLGYQYQHFHVLGTSFHNNAYDASFTLHLFDWLTGGSGRLAVGAEGAVNAGFGGKTSGNPSLDAKSLFLGAGPHLTVQSRSRFQPWIHGLVGWEHLRFTQTSVLGSNSALGFIVGGGVDIRLAPEVSWRVEGNYVGTHFQPGIQSNYSAGTGLVLYF